MGRVKGRITKTTAHNLIDANSALFGTEFTKNKEMLRKLGINAQNPVERNKLAGEITNLMKQIAPLAE